jgi:hypothetical protein
MSTPPPSHTPPPAAPEPAPRKHKRAMIAGGIAALIVVLLLLAHHKTEPCVVNGFGNQLCGEAAVAYCDLLERQGILQPRPATKDELPLFDTCTDVGWTPAS